MNSAEQILKQLEKTGGAIVLAADLTEEDVKLARSENRIYKNDTGTEFVYDSFSDLDQEAGFSLGSEQ